MKKLNATLMLLVIALLLVGCERQVKVNGTAMEPTFKNNDIINVDFTYYISNTPKRGDIVLLKTGDNEIVIKRVIGLPSEKLEIKDNKVYINDAELKEDYIKDGLYNSLVEQTKWDIPEKSVFVMGDNRKTSKDSRDYGTISYDKILGKFIN